MANTTTSQFMLLPVPVPTVDPGPQWSVDVNTCLTTVDQHDHSTGKGTQINPAGININADLPFNSSFNATLIRSVRFKAQASPLSLGADIGCVYVAGLDLYYNDVNGNQVRLTASGAVAGTPGSIGNLVSPANVTYNSGTQTYVFQATTSTAGGLDGASVTIRKTSANSPGITLSAPVALSSNYTLTFPALLPSSGSTPKILTVDQNGNVSDVYDVDNVTLQVSSNLLNVRIPGITGITGSQLAPQTITSTQIANQTIAGSNLTALNYQASQAVNASITSTVFSTITGLTCTITTVGRPVYGMLQATSGSNSITWGAVGIGNSLNGNILFQRDTTIISNSCIRIPAGTNGVAVPPSSFSFMDMNASSGVHTYQVFGACGNGVALTIEQVQLVVWEL